MARPTMVTLPFQNLRRKGALPIGMAYEPMGWGGEALGAWGHPTEDPVILKVTNLSNDENEEGSFFWAASQNYPRIIVFEVGGVIDMEWKDFGFRRLGQFDITNPYLCVAGQTAPSPGITIIRGGLWIFTHDVIFQHIIVRTGEHPTDPANNRMDAFTIRGDNEGGQSDILIDHCSFTWGTRYTISAFAGVESDRWERTRRITLSNSIIGEAITADNWGVGGIVSAGELVLARNLWGYNNHRQPHLTDSRVIYLNNYVAGRINNPVLNGGEVTFIGNVGRDGGHPDTVTGYRLHRQHSDTALPMYADDNVMYDFSGSPYANWRSTSAGEPVNYLDEPGIWHDSLDDKIILTDNLLVHLQNNVGARPWDRDSIDQRIVDEAINVNGRLPYGEAAGWEPSQWVIAWDEGWYPDYEPTYKEFNPDEWYIDAEHPGVEPK